MSNLLFAYGFLKREFQGNQMTQTPPFLFHYIGDGYFPGRMYLVEDFPGAIYLPEWTGQVHGEILKLENAEKALSILDEYEHAAPLIQEDPWYSRQLRSVTTATGVVKCWVYEYRHHTDGLQEIKDGKFTYKP